MPMHDTPRGQPDERMPLLLAAGLQDSLMIACHDLGRLDSLLSGACDELLLRFSRALEQIQGLAGSPRESQPGSQALEAAATEVARAVTALQFQDMATQLIAHTRTQLRHCTDQLALQAFGEDEDGAPVLQAAPLRANPVTQSEIDAGSIELF